MNQGRLNKLRQAALYGVSILAALATGDFVAEGGTSNELVDLAPALLLGFGAATVALARLFRTLMHSMGDMQISMSKMRTERDEANQRTEELRQVIGQLELRIEAQQHKIERLEIAAGADQRVISALMQTCGRNQSGWMQYLLIPIAGLVLKQAYDSTK